MKKYISSPAKRAEVNHNVGVVPCAMQIPKSLSSNITRMSSQKRSFIACQNDAIMQIITAKIITGDNLIYFFLIKSFTD